MAYGDFKLGFCMTRYDDKRLNGLDANLETRRESFCIRWPRLIVYGLSNRDETPTIEIAYEDTCDLRMVIDVAMAHGFEKSQKWPPSKELIKRWRLEERDAQLMAASEKFTDEELERMLELRQVTSDSDTLISNEKANEKH